MATQTQLPYLTQPTTELVEVGNSAIGILQFPKLYGLSDNEHRFIKEHSKNLPNLQKEAVKLAKAIAQQTKRKVVEVYDDLVGGNTDSLSDFLEEVINFQEMLNLSTEQKTVLTATAVIKFRLVPEWTVEDTGNPQKIKPAMVGAIAEFAAHEEMGWVEVDATPQTEQEREEELGKS